MHSLPRILQAVRSPPATEAFNLALPHVPYTSSTQPTGAEPSTWPLLVPPPRLGKQLASTMHRHVLS